jgi:predicted glycosyltransferase
MNREAAGLGVPAASIYAGKWAAIDEQLVSEGRLWKLTSAADVESLIVRRKPDRQPRANKGTRAEVVMLILDES